MKDVRIDATGAFRCWNCGGRSFTEKRTFRSKALVGVGALLTKKKLKCQTCGEYNDTGSAKPWSGPASKRLGKKYGTDDVPEAPVGAPAPPAEGSVADELGKLAALHGAGVLTDEEFAAQKAKLLEG